MQNSMNAKDWQRMQACILGVSRGLKLFPCPVHKMKWCAGGAPQRNVREVLSAGVSSTDRADTGQPNEWDRQIFPSDYVAAKK
jgi:hypothetical protein